MPNPKYYQITLPSGSTQIWDESKVNRNQQWLKDKGATTEEVNQFEVTLPSGASQTWDADKYGRNIDWLAEHQAQVRGSLLADQTAQARQEEPVEAPKVQPTVDTIRQQPVQQDTIPVQKDSVQQPIVPQVQPVQPPVDTTTVPEREAALAEVEAAAQREAEERQALQQANREQVAELNGYIENQLSDAMAESSRQYDEGVKKKGFFARGLEMMARDPMEGFSTTTTSDRFTGAGNPELQNRIQSLQAAQKAMKDAQNVIDEANHAIEHGDYEGWLKKFAGGAARGFGDKFADLSTWDMGMSDARDAQAMLQALNDYESGKPLTDAQQTMLDAKAVEMATHAYFGSYLGRGYKAGAVTAESLPFMLEMMINPASSVGEAATNRLARYAIKRFGKQAAKSAAGKVSRAVGRAAADLAGAAIMSGTTGAMGVAGETMERMAGDVDFATDAEGKSIFAGVTPGSQEDFGTAFRKAFAGRTIENYSEMVGNYFAPVLGAAGEAAGRGLEKVGLGEVRDFLKVASKSDISRIVNDFAKHTQWHGTIGEYAEEVVGNIMNALVVGDMTLDAAKDTGVFNLDQNIDTFLGVALLGGVMSGIKSTGYRTPKYRARTEISSASRAVDASFDGAANWEDLKATMNEDPNAALHEVLTGDYTPEQRQAVLNYAKTLKEYEGVLDAESKRRTEQETPLEEVQTDLETSYDNGYTLATDEEMNDAKNNLEYQRQRIQQMLGLSDISEEQILDDADLPLEADQREAAMDYLNAKATYDGLIHRIQDDINERIAAANAEVDINVNQADGQIHPAELLDGRHVYITGGNVVVSEDGTIDKPNSTRDIIIRDVETGKKEFSSLEFLKSADPTIDPQEEKQAAAQSIREQTARSYADRIDGRLQFQQGDVYELTPPQGEPFTVQVVPNEEGLIDNGDGTVNVLVGSDPRIQLMQKDVVQQLADNTRLARLGLHEQQKAEKKAQEAEAARPAYNINDNVTVDVDGAPIRGTITDITADGIEFYSEVPINGRVMNVFPLEQFDPIVREHNGQAVEAPVQVQPEIAQEQGQIEQNEAQIAQETPVSEQPQGPAIDRVPKDEKGEPVFENADVADTYQALLDMNEGDEAETVDTAAQMVENVQKELEKATKAKAKGTSPMEIQRSKAANREQVKALQKKLDYWQKVAGYPEMVRKNAEEEAKRQRRARLAEARKIQEKNGRFAKEDAQLGEPLSFRDFIMRNIANGFTKFKWSDDATTSTKGLGAHLGFSGKSQEAIRRGWLLNNETGLYPEAAAEELLNAYAASMGVDEIPGMTTMDAFNELLDVLNSYDSSRSMFDAAKKAHEEAAGIYEHVPAVEDYVEEEETPVEETQEPAQEQVEPVEEAPAQQPEAEQAPATPMSEEQRTEIREMLEAGDGDLRLLDVMSSEEAEAMQQAYDTYMEVQRVNEEAIAAARREIGSTTNKTRRQIAQQEIDKANRNIAEALTPLMDQHQAMLRKYGFEQETNPEDEAPVNETQAAIQQAREEVNPAPTDAQKEAGNYRKGHVTVDSYDISIENAKGSTRSGVDAQGNPWETTMNNDYGYIRRTEGVDGDHIDVFLSDNPEEGNVFVVDQVDPETGEFDEHKVMYGFPDADAAREAYLANYSEGWKGLGNITEVTKDEFRKWIDSSHRKTKPFAEYRSVKPVQQEESTPAVKRTPVQNHPANLRAAYETGDAEKIAAAEKVLEDYINNSDNVMLLRGTENVASRRKKEVAKDSAEYRTQGFIAKAVKARLGQMDKAVVKAYDDARRVYEDRFTSPKEDLESAIAYFEGERNLAQNLLDNVPEDADELYVISLKNRISSANNHLNNLNVEMNRFDDEAPTEQQPEDGITIEPAQYTNKKGKTTDMYLVKPGRELTKEELAAGKSLAKDSRGWYDREKGGFMMRSEDSAKALAESLRNPQAVADAQPLSLSDMRENGPTTIDTSEVKAPAEEEKEPVWKYELHSNPDTGYSRLERSQVLADGREIWDGNWEVRSDSPTELKEILQNNNMYDLLPDADKATLDRRIDVYKFRKSARENGVNGYRIGEKVMYKGKEATIHEFEDYSDHRPVLDSGLAPVIYEIANWEDISKIEAPAKDFAGEHIIVTGIPETKKTEERPVNPSGNKLVTDERYAELRMKMLEKLKGQMNMGIDPEILAIGTEMAVYHIEKGARKFVDYAKAMIKDLGDVIRPYLKAFYNAVRDLPEAEQFASEMDSYEDVQAVDVANFDREAPADPATVAETVVKEREADKQAEVAEKKLKKVRNSSRKSVSSQQKAPAMGDLFAGLEEQQEEPINEEENGTQRPGTVRSEGVSDSVRPEGAAEERTGEDGREAGQEGGRPNEGRSEGRKQPDSDSRRGLDDSVKRNTRNFRLSKGEEAPRTPAARFKANIAAIRLLKQLQESGKKATKEDMAVLSKYTGWGGLGTYFNTRWGHDYDELKSVLSAEQMKAAELSINTAYYTPTEIIDTMWDVAKRLGFTGGRVLEGSAGIGNILASMPKSMSDRSQITAVEVDETTGGILELLYPDAKVHISGFEKVDIPNGSVDLAITNVPFSNEILVNDEKETDLTRKFGSRLHDFCIAKNIRKLAEGGIGIFITTRGTLDSGDSQKLRDWIVNEGGCDYLGAFRLNNETFEGTGATSDIIVVRKRVNGEKLPSAVDLTKTEITRRDSWTENSASTKWKDVEHPVAMTYNSYYVEHPEFMAGDMLFAFDKGSKYRAGSAGLYPAEGKDQSKMLGRWAKTFTSVDIPARKTSLEDYLNRAEAQEDTKGTTKEGQVVTNSKGEICLSRSGKAIPIGVNANKVKGYTKKQVLADYDALKSAINDALEYQQTHDTDEGLKPLLDRLNKAYDTFVGRYGYFHKNPSLAWLRNDVDYASTAAVEDYKETKAQDGTVTVSVSKTGIFKGRMIGAKRVPTPTSTKDGVLVSMNEFGRINIPFIAQALGKTEEDVKSEIIEEGIGFENPLTGEVDVAYNYLSGNVREKLKYAKDHNEGGRYDKNIKALEKVIPADIPAHLIEFSLGSDWLPVDLYKQYAQEKLGLNERWNPTGFGGVWRVADRGGFGENNEKNRAAGVASDMCNSVKLGHELLLAAMNNTTVSFAIKVQDDEKHSHTEYDKKATEAANTKIAEMRDDFKDWLREKLQAEPELAQQIQKTYNDTFNAIAPKEISEEFLPGHFDGQVLEMGGKPFALYPHQSKAVVRATTEPVLFAHEVGTGKTFTLITSAMEMRRLGTAKKPMIVVQNATVGQFVKSAKELYPQAKILTINDKDRTEEGRAAFYAKIKYNDWDLIIIPQSVFNMIPDSEARKRAFVQERIDELKFILAQAEAAGNQTTVQDLRKQLDDLYEERDFSGEEREGKKKGKKRDAKKEAVKENNAEVKAKKQLARRTDEVADFDAMEIDALLIDEAHEYKHLGFTTSMTRGVKGIDPGGSKKAAALYLKTRSVFDRAGWKNVVFATGTPISNTAAEIWTFMKYLLPNEVREANHIYYFDDFVHNFGNILTNLEFTTSGKFKEVTRFSAYTNLPELMRIWLTVADIVLSREAVAAKASDGTVSKLDDKIPVMRTWVDDKGVEHVNEAQDYYLPQSPALRSIMAAVRAELERFENMTGKEKKQNSHIPLNMFGIARAAAIDPRLVSSSAKDEPLSKTNAAVKEILKDLEDTEEYNGTTVVFCDRFRRLAFDPNTGKRSLEAFNVFNDIKEKLIAAGVPADKIVIIRAGMKDDQKQRIFDRVNSGEVRVIMGTTAGLGTGVNIQERLYSEYHMDTPDRPMDYTQRMGRLLRQGNLHKPWGKPVKVVRFGVEDSLDVTGYQRLSTKAKFINSIMEGKKTISNSMENRVLEEEDEGIFDNPVAVLSGSQFALLKSQAEKELRKLRNKKEQYELDQIYIEYKLGRNDGAIASEEEKIERYRKALDELRGYFPDGKVNEITVEGKKVKTDEQIAEAIKEKITGPIRALINKQRDKAEQEYNYQNWSEDRYFTITLDGIPVKVRVMPSVKKEYDTAERREIVSSSVQLNVSCPKLGITERWFGGGINGVKDIIPYFINDIIPGKGLEQSISRAEADIERMKSDNELMRQRRGKPFADEEKLAKQEEIVADLTEKMREEMAEKEAKYKAMAADTSGGFNLEDIDYDEDDEEEGEGSGSGSGSGTGSDTRRYREASEISDIERDDMLHAGKRDISGYQKRLDELNARAAKEGADMQVLNREKADLFNEYLEQASTSDIATVSVPLADLKGWLMDRGVSEERADATVASYSDPFFVGEYNTDTDTAIFLADRVPFMDYLREELIHERQHKRTLQAGNELIKRVANAFGYDKDPNFAFISLYNAIQALTKNADSYLLPGSSLAERISTLANELPSYAMQKKYSDENFENTLKKHYIAQEAIDLINELYEEGRRSYVSRHESGNGFAHGGISEPAPGVNNETSPEEQPGEVQGRSGNEEDTGRYPRGGREGEDGVVRYRIREDEPPKKTGIGYKVFVLKNGALYPPMVANPGGAATPVGVWLDADAAPVVNTTKTGRQQVKAGGKGTQGGSGTLSFRPGWHLGTIPYAIQFNRQDEQGNKALFPKDFVWAEVEYANDVDYQDEAMSYGKTANGGFNNALAGLPKLPVNGSYTYRTNPDPKTDPWIITGAMKVNRLLTPSEVDAMVEAAGREPQKRQRGAVTDAQIEDLNARIFSEADNTPAAVAEAVKGLGNAFGVKVRTVMDANELTDENPSIQRRMRRAKGWYDTATGEVVVVVPNSESVADAKATVFHEIVAHQGLREMVGEENFNRFLDRVYRGASEDIRAQITALARQQGWDFHEATEEYLANMAEEGFDARENRTFWEKVRDLFEDMISAAKLRLGFHINDRDLRYALWRSYQMRKASGAAAVAEDIMMQRKMQVGEYAPKRFRDPDEVLHDRIQVRDHYERALQSGLYQFREAVQDSMLSLRELMQAIAGNTPIEEIDAFENPYLAENAMSSMNKAEQEAYYKLVMTPLLEEIAKFGVPEQEVKTYMMAKHGLERNIVMAERYGREAFDADTENTKTLAEHIADARKRDYAGLQGLTGTDNVADAEQEATSIVQAFEGAHNADALWDKTNAATKASLQKLYDCGLLTREGLDAITKMYDYYVPLRGFDATTSDEVYGYLTDRKGMLNSPLKKAEGRSSQADDPIAYIASMADTAIMQGNRNKMKQRFLNFALNHPSDLVSVSSLWLSWDDVANEWKPVFADLKPEDSPEEVERKVEAFNEKMKALAETDPDHYKGGKDTVNIPYKIVGDNLKEHQVLVKRGGRTYVLTINGNPRAAQALNGLTNPDTDISGFIGSLIRGGQKINRALSSVYTTRNPEFVLSNFLRDMFYSNLMNWVKESPAYAIRFHKNVGRFVPSRMFGLFKKWENGTLDEADPVENLFKQFMLNGGETGYTTVKDLDRQKKELSKQVEAYGKKMPVKNAMDFLGQSFDIVNRGVENCARFAAFVTSREMGRTIQRSIYDAKEVSVNFNKKGAGDRFVNAAGQTLLGKIGGYSSAAGRLLYVFWNAGVQSLTNFGRAAKNHPYKAAAEMFSLFALGAAVAALAGAGGDGDDDDENAYYNLPEYVRRSNICFRVGKSWITIPLPIEFRGLYGLGELMVGVVGGKENYSNSELAYQIGSQVSQVLPLDMLEGGGGISPFIPSAAKPVVEAYIRNKSWSGVPIYKDTYFNKNMPEWTKAYKSANRQLVELAETANRLSGGDEYTKGAVDLNPARIEYLLSGYFGGYEKLVNKLIKMGETAVGAREFEWRNMLIASSVVKSGDERTAHRKLTNEYWNIVDKAEKVQQRLRGYENRADEGDEAYERKLEELENSPEYLLYEICDEYKPDIDAIRRDIKEETDPEVVKELEAEMYDLMRQMVDAVHESKNK